MPVSKSAEQMRKRRGSEPRPCAGCGQMFDRESWVVKVCSDECRKRAHKEAYRRYANRGPQSCIECGALVPGDDYRLRTCSEQCRLARQRRTKQFKRAHNRASSLGLLGEPFTEQELAEWLNTRGRSCVYCGGPYESLDHIIPLSRAGLHQLSNLNPSCRACNASKGDRLLSEWEGRVVTDGCLTEGCDGTVLARGMCQRCYNKWNWQRKTL